ncbi:MAG: linear amide C-N hydrolase [Candidatus Lokiarchaeota archaeon]
MRSKKFDRKKFPHILIILILLFSIIFPILFVSDHNFSSCTIFTVTKDGSAFFANNEDEGLQNGRIWFYPSFNNKYGKLLFGYPIQHDVDVYVGGMNDQGLCFDMTMVDRTPINRDPNKIDLQGAFFLQMLDVCASVEDVKNWTQNYNLHLLTWQQVHIADKNGDAIVIGLDSRGNFVINEKQGNYLISTNSFNLAQTRTHCWRYDLVEDRLDSLSSLTLEYCRDILEATKLSSTMYSYIINLNNGDIYLYSHKNFNDFAVINTFEEIGKGYHSYDIQTIVSQQSNVLFAAFNEELLLTVLFPSILLVTTIIALSLLIYYYKIKPLFH